MLNYAGHFARNVARFTNSRKKGTMNICNPQELCSTKFNFYIMY